MARRSKSGSRSARRRSEAAAKLLATGAAFAVGPLFVGGTVYGKAFAALIPIGLFMLVAGVLLTWLQRRGDDDGGQPADRFSPIRSRSADASYRPSAARLSNVVAIRPVAQGPGAPAHERIKPDKWGSEVFDVIEWRRFEAVVEALFQQAGFETKSQTHGADEGVDIWLYSRNQPGEPVSLVQCKHWQGKRVGVDKIRELRGVMASRNVRRGQFATTSTFTPDATAFARDNGINLLDVSGLLALIGKRSPEQQQALLDVALEGDYWRPTCVNCGVKMVNRVRRKGGSNFWGCTSYPTCKTTLPMRAHTT